jgi:hypothetical protein
VLWLERDDLISSLPHCCQESAARRMQRLFWIWGRQFVLLVCSSAPGHYSQFAGHRVPVKRLQGRCRAQGFHFISTLKSNRNLFQNSRKLKAGRHGGHLFRRSGTTKSSWCKSSRVSRSWRRSSDATSWKWVWSLMGAKCPPRGLVTQVLVIQGDRAVSGWSRGRWTGTDCAPRDRALRVWRRLPVDGREHRRHPQRRSRLPQDPCRAGTRTGRKRPNVSRSAIRRFRHDVRLQPRVAGPHVG